MAVVGADPSARPQQGHRMGAVLLVQATPAGGVVGVIGKQRNLVQDRGRWRRRADDEEGPKDVCLVGVCVRRRGRRSRRRVYASLTISFHERDRVRASGPIRRDRESECRPRTICATIRGHRR